MHGIEALIIFDMIQSSIVLHYTINCAICEYKEQTVILVYALDN